MIRANTHKRTLRLLVASILAIFVVGSASGPLRTCYSHLGHAPGSAQALHAGAETASSHHVSGHAADDPAAGHEGCSCLGRCSPEQAPYLPGADTPSLAHAPAVPKTLVAAWIQPLPEHDPLNLPLARPPPTVL
ncbi:MAG: hypothetical protein PVJ80_07150 [Gemmatimonadota bacterium]|jgi:hypothetical protein